MPGGFDVEAIDGEGEFAVGDGAAKVMVGRCVWGATVWIDWLGGGHGCCLGGCGW